MHILITIPDYNAQGSEVSLLCANIEQSLAGEFHGVEVTPLDELEMHVIANNNAFDGITLEGPFFDSDEAALHAESTSDEWHIVKVNKPEVA